MEVCPCGTKKSYEDCCGIFITGTQLPATPEQLMRSRYTAYTRGNIEYIEQTMCGPAAHKFSAEKANIWANEVTWLGLKVLRSNSQNDKGYVEFIAKFKEQEKAQKIHEISQFSLINGKWYYTDGKHRK